SWRIDSQRLERHAPGSAATHLRGGAWIKDLGELDGLLKARELDEHFIVAKAQVVIAAGGQPAEVVRPDDRDAATGPADPLHLRQARVTTVTRFGRERRTDDYQVRPIVGQRQSVEETMSDGGTVAVS